MLTYVCNWLGYTLGTNADIDKIVYTTAGIIVVAFVVFIISLINRLLNVFLIGRNYNK